MVYLYGEATLPSWCSVIFIYKQPILTFLFALCAKTTPNQVSCPSSSAGDRVYNPGQGAAAPQDLS